MQIPSGSQDNLRNPNNREISKGFIELKKKIFS